MKRPEIFDDKTKPLCITRGVKNAGFPADLETISFQSTFISWDEGTVSISSTFHTPSRWHTLDETDANKKAKKQSQNEIAQTFADVYGLLQTFTD